MKTVTTQLKFGEVQYPQLLRLPKGVYLVKQDGYPEIKSIKKYAVFLKSGKMITAMGGNSVRAARNSALERLNYELGMVKLTYGSLASIEDYKKVIS